MPDDLDWRLLDRHLAGETSPDDELALRHWVAADPGRDGMLRALSSAVRTADEEHWDTGRAWSRVSARLQDPQRLSLYLERRPSSGPRGRVWLVAGVIAATVLVLIVWRQLESRRTAVGMPTVSEISAAPSQQTSFTLRDGTRIVLNAGSRLRYSTGFGIAARDVDLDGEGYFEVVHDPARSFRVHAAGTVTEDLGTRFVVRAYPELGHVDVAVSEGHVSLRHDGASAHSMVGAGQRGRSESDGSVRVVDDVDVERWFDWTRGGLLLDDVTLRLAAKDIGRRFGVRVDIADATLASRHVSARFRNETLPHVLDAISAMVGARWTRDGDRVLLEKVP
jgi:transmembrane sensor